MDGVTGTEYVIVLILGLLAKHFVADYLLQSAWIIGGKGRLTHPGGYVHAGLHVLGSFLVLSALGVVAPPVWLLCAGEFVVHYLLDFTKARLDRYFSSVDAPWKYWAAHGLDQLLHHLTYIVMVWLIVTGF